MMVRTFVSIPIPVTPPISELLIELKQIGVRTTPEKQIHLTLSFIGDIDEKRLPDVEKCVMRSIEGVKSSKIELNGMGGFPNSRSPHIVWIGIKTDIPLEKIAESIGSEFDIIKIDHDRKEFKAHITIGRISRKSDISNIIEKYKNTEFSIVDCNTIKIMKSELMPSGAKHTQIYSLNLAN